MSRSRVDNEMPHVHFNVGLIYVRRALQSEKSRPAKVHPFVRFAGRRRVSGWVTLVTSSLRRRATLEIWRDEINLLSRLFVLRLIFFNYFALASYVCATDNRDDAASVSADNIMVWKFHPIMRLITMMS